MRIGSLPIRYPLLLPLTGMAAGIVAAANGLPLSALCPIAIIAVAAFCIATFYRTSGRLRTSCDFVWILSASIAIGLFTATIHRPQNLDYEQRSWLPYARATIEQKKTRESEILTVKVNAFTNLHGKEQRVNNTRVMLITDATDFQEGDEIIFPHNLKRIKDDNRHPFGGALMKKGILYSQNFGDDPPRRIGHSNSLRFKIREIRSRLNILIDKSSLTDSSGNVVKAILLGDSSDIPDDKRTLFSQAGIAHILALSGMHVGIVAAVITMFLFPIGGIMRGKLRWIIVVAVVWIYVVFTGILPSALRATIMLTFYFLAIILERRNSSLNAIFGAVCIILVFAPYDLFNSGLQLSFVTVVAIICVCQKLETMGYRKTGWIYYLTAPAVTCLAAVLGSLGLSAYLFHTVPLWFLPVNLIVLPFLPFVLISAAIYVAGLATGIDIYPLASIINGAEGILSDIISHLASHGWMYIKIWPSQTSVWLYYITLLTTAIAFSTRRRISAIFPIAGAVATTIALIYIPGEKPLDGFIISGSGKTMRMEIFADGESYRQQVSAEETPRIFSLQGKKIILTPGLSEVHRQPLQCDYLVVTACPDLRVADLLKAFSPQEIVILPYFFNSSETDMKIEAQQAGIPAHSITADGPKDVVTSR